jgi:hypothetical protein
MIDKVLNATHMEAENTNCLQGTKVCQSIGGGTGPGMGTREKQLTAVSSRYQQVCSAPSYTISMHDRV